MLAALRSVSDSSEVTGIVAMRSPCISRVRRQGGGESGGLPLRFLGGIVHDW